MGVQTRRIHSFYSLAGTDWDHHSQGLGAHYQPEAGAADLRITYQRILGKGLMALHRHLAPWGQ